MALNTSGGNRLCALPESSRPALIMWTDFHACSCALAPSVSPLAPNFLSLWHSTWPNFSPPWVVDTHAGLFFLREMNSTDNGVAMVSHSL